MENERMWETGEQDLELNDWLNALTLNRRRKDEAELRELARDVMNELEAVLQIKEGKLGNYPAMGQICRDIYTLGRRMTDAVSQRSGRDAR